MQKHFFSSGESIIEGLVSGHLDVGCMGLSPALVAIDKGAKFKIAFGLSLNYDDMLFTTSIYDLNTLNDYMLENGFLKQKRELNELVWDENLVIIDKQLPENKQSPENL